MQTAPAAPGLGSCVAGVRINVELGCVFLYAAELKFQFTSFLQVDGDLKLTAEKTQKKPASIAKNKQKLQQHLGGVETLSTRSDERSAGVPAGSAQCCETKLHFFFLSSPAGLKKNAISSGPHSKQEEQKEVSNGEMSV